jgi:hypothetical protein
MLPLLFEDLCREPGDTMEAIYRFHGLNPQLGSLDSWPPDHLAPFERIAAKLKPFLRVWEIIRQPDQEAMSRLAER